MFARGGARDIETAFIIVIDSRASSEDQGKMSEMMDTKRQENAKSMDLPVTTGGSSSSSSSIPMVSDATN